MFCYQCEQTVNGKGCMKMGVCGKSPEASALQDLIMGLLKGLAVYGDAARQLGIKDESVDLAVIEGLFTTVTNVSFDVERLAETAKKVYQAKEKIKELYIAQAGQDLNTKPAVCDMIPSDSVASMVVQGQGFNILEGEENEDIRSLKELLTYGLKGTAAYADHAWILGEKNEAVIAFFYKALAKLTQDLSADELVNLNMECGQANFQCMEALDKGNTEHFGHPEPTQVSFGVKKGPAILVSGHDLLDLEYLLKQTEGKGINIYTHGEMLPAHGYPKLKKYSHLVGNYGGAWQDQQKEFAAFPGAILMTTNCIQKPAANYQDRIFTTGLVSFEGVKHIENRNDFSPLIEKALALGGFHEDQPGKETMVGFAHHSVLSVADQVIAAVKGGAVKHFFLVGGCDGAKSGRNYYTELAEKIPADCLILTLACGKFRFNTMDLGKIGDFPRLMDVGQCNDAYSAIVIAVKLAEAFGISVNELPLSMILSWYEQKAVCILLTLLSLGIKNIKLGPSLPAFVSPNILNVLVEKFNIGPITTPEEDIKAALA
ncbi:MAG: hydroxylamine reductase [Spirochaetes bacterium]|nr:hydroxylamine reductase [Spirochaetota bacterium]